MHFSVNATFSSFEIVLIGKENSRKGIILETFLGHPLIPLVSMHRPVFVHLVHSPENETPKITVKRDSKLGDHPEKCFEGKWWEVPNEILSRNTKVIADKNHNLTKEFSQIPVVVKYEWKYCGNVTFIDTPGLMINTSVSFVSCIHNVIESRSRGKGKDCH